jgi:hypothetical protein
MIDKLKELVESSEMSNLQKMVINGFIERSKQAADKHSSDISWIEQVANEKYISEVILSTEEVKIYTVRGKDEWAIKYPYRSIFINKSGNWERSTTVSPSLDVALLVYLEKKHLGSNSQFLSFALKMLEIKLDE